jgi:protein ImuB
VLVLYSAGSRGLRVTACSRAARGLGVAVGMPVAEAAALAQLTRSRRADVGKAPRWAKTGLRAGRIEFLPEDPLADREALEQLAGWCQRYSPLVSVEQADRPESLLIDATGCSRCFHGEPALVEKIARELTQRGLESRVVVADSIGAAWALAHYGSAEKTYAAVPPGRSERLLDPLPIEALRLPAESVATLHELGIVRIGELARLPADLLAGCARRPGRRPRCWRRIARFRS